MIENVGLNATRHQDQEKAMTEANKIRKHLEALVSKNESLHLVSGFSADKVEEAYRDGWNDRMIGTDTFHISNYR